MPITVQSGRDGKGTSVSKPVIDARRITSTVMTLIDEALGRVDCSCESWVGEMLVLVNTAQGAKLDLILTHRVGGPETKLQFGDLTITGTFNELPRQVNDLAKRNTARVAHAKDPDPNGAPGLRS